MGIAILPSDYEKLVILSRSTLLPKALRTHIPHNRHHDADAEYPHDCRGMSGSDPDVLGSPSLTRRDLARLAGLEVETLPSNYPATKNALASLFQLQGERRKIAHCYPVPRPSSRICDARLSGFVPRSFRRRFSRRALSVLCGIARSRAGGVARALWAVGVRAPCRSAGGARATGRRSAPRLASASTISAAPSHGGRRA